MLNCKIKFLEEFPMMAKKGDIASFINGEVHYPDSFISSTIYNSIEDYKKKNPSAKFELIPDLPHICEVLGVEVGEKFDFLDESGTMQFKDYYVNENGNIVTVGNSGMSSQTRLEALINGKIKIIRQPQFSADEKALMREFAKAGFPIFYRSAGGSLRAKKTDDSNWIAFPNAMLKGLTPEAGEVNAAEYLGGCHD